MLFSGSLSGQPSQFAPSFMASARLHCCLAGGGLFRMLEESNLVELHKRLLQRAHTLNRAVWQGVELLLRHLAELSIGLSDLGDEAHHRLEVSNADGDIFHSSPRAMASSCAMLTATSPLSRLSMSKYLAGRATSFSEASTSSML